MDKKKIDKKAVGYRIKQIRLSKRCTLEQFANLIGTSRSNVWQWENGMMLPTGSRLVKIVEIADITINELLYGDIRKEEEQMRGFELIEGLDGELPVKATVSSAGVDFIASEDIRIPAFRFKGTATLVPTGVKAFMQEDEYLQIFARSSIPVNMGLLMSNGVGIIDADYYNNPKNEGHIMIEFTNLTNEHITIKKGERIAQGIFNKVLPVTHGVTIKNATRSGGFGSTGEK